MIKSHIQSSYHRSRIRLGWMMLIPSLSILIVFAIWPALNTAWLSFRDTNLIFQKNNFIGIQNYRNLLSDPIYWIAVKNTFIFTLGSVALETIIGVSLALIMNLRWRLKGIIRAAILVPWAIPTVVTSTMWGWVFNTDYGIANWLLSSFNISINWLGEAFWAMSAAIIADVWKTTPFIALICLAGLQTIPNALLDAAKVDGTSKWQRFWYVILPLLKPILLVAILLRVLDAFRVFALIFVLTNGGPANGTEVLSTYGYKVLFSTLKFGYGSSIAMSMFFYVAMITAVFLMFLHRSIASESH